MFWWKTQLQYSHKRETQQGFIKGIDLLRNLSNKLPRQALVTIYKAFLRPRLDYGDIVYDKPDNETFIYKIEKAQSDAALAVTGAIRGTSWEKLYAFFLHCHNFLNIRRKLFDKIKLLDETLLQLNDESLLTVLLFGSKIYNEQVNVQILNASIDYIINSDRFTGSLI